jgi:Hemerythrin HHE cation binding domain
MTTKVSETTHSTTAALAVSEPDRLTLVGEHAVLLQGVHRRVWPVLALIDTGTWPTAELHTLVAFLRTSLLRQASDEEALLFPCAAATPFAELAAQHARMHALTERLAHANVTHCPLSELRCLVAELTNVLARHLAAEQVLLGRLAEPSQAVPSAAEVASNGQTWLAAHDGPLQIVLDDLPVELATQLCIERLLRLRPSQIAEVRSSDSNALIRVRQWMRAFDSASYGIEFVSQADHAHSYLQVTRRSIE